MDNNSHPEQPTNANYVPDNQNQLPVAQPANPFKSTLIIANIFVSLSVLGFLLSLHLTLSEIDTLEDIDVFLNISLLQLGISTLIMIASLTFAAIAKIGHSLHARD